MIEYLRYPKYRHACFSSSNSSFFRRLAAVLPDSICLRFLGSYLISQLQDFSWHKHGYSLLDRLYPNIGGLLDSKFKAIISLTYKTWVTSLLFQSFVICSVSSITYPDFWKRPGLWSSRTYYFYSLWKEYCCRSVIFNEWLTNWCGTFVCYFDRAVHWLFLATCGFYCPVK